MADLTIEPTSASFGATVRGLDLRRDLDPSTAGHLRDAWLQHQVLVFPDQDLSFDDLEAVAGAFGPIGEDPYFRPMPGQAHVVALMNQTGAVIGGEGNGGVIDPRVGWVRDPFIGVALVLSLLADTGKKLSALVAELTSYTIVKEKFTVTPERLLKLYDALAKYWPEAKANSLDGLRLDWLDRWVHIRPSNTEPIARVIAEASTAAEAEKLCAVVKDMINRC